MSSFVMIKTIFLNQNPNIKIYTIETSLKNNNDQIIIANSITLTPGTITIEKNSNTITVLCLNHKIQKHQKIKDSIIGKFENILMKKKA